MIYYVGDVFDHDNKGWLVPVFGVSEGLLCEVQRLRVSKREHADAARDEKLAEGYKEWPGVANKRTLEVRS